MKLITCPKGLRSAVNPGWAGRRKGPSFGIAPLVLQVRDISTWQRSWPIFSLDWVVSLFHRVLALFENLPEEGGKKNTTGGKQEENMLKSIQGMLDVICLHLSDQLFDLVLNLVFDYAMTNAKSNAVRPFGQLVACIARVRPEKTIAKFLSPSRAQIEEELKHGASSVRTTSTHAAVPSDTTLHWRTYSPRRKLISSQFFWRCVNPSWLSGVRWFRSELDRSCLWDLKN